MVVGKTENRRNMIRRQDSKSWDAMKRRRRKDKNDKNQIPLPHHIH